MMKKLGLLGVVALVGATVAFAGTMQIPFFNDGGPANSDGSGFPSSGTASWICVKNPSTSGALTITVRYYDNSGTERTPGANTYSIPAGAAVSWRPVAIDPMEGTEGNLVPNKNGGPKNGSAIVSYSGSAHMIGRVAVCNGSVDDSYGFMLESD